MTVTGLVTTIIGGILGTIIGLGISIWFLNKRNKSRIGKYYRYVSIFDEKETWNDLLVHPVKIDSKERSYKCEIIVDIEHLTHKSEMNFTIMSADHCFVEITEEEWLIKNI